MVSNESAGGGVQAQCVYIGAASDLGRDMGGNVALYNLLKKSQSKHVSMNEAWGIVAANFANVDK